MSLRWKVALMLAATAVIISLTVGVATYRLVSDRLLVEVDRSLVAFDPSYLGRQVPAGAPDPFRGFDLQRIDSDGVVTVSSFPAINPISPEALSLVDRPRTELFETISTEGGPARVRTIGVPGGAIQVIRSLNETQRVLASLRVRVLTLGLWVSMAASLLGWLLADRVTAPLRRLTAAARKVESTGRLDEAGALSGKPSSHDEVGQLETAFTGMLSTLSRSQDDQRRLVQDAGHELRTPLTSLRTNIETLGRYREMTDVQRAEIITDLRAETTELTTLVNELVAAGSGDLSDEPFVSFDLARVVDDLAVRFERRHGREVTVDSRPSPVFGRRSAVQRAISCLFDNAEKFDTTGGPITVKVADSTVTVADRGVGVPPDEVEMIFDRFHRADGARSLPGSGLGLSIVREVAVTHGGSASVKARAGGGSEFSLTLGSAAFGPLDDNSSVELPSN